MSNVTYASPSGKTVNVEIIEQYKFAVTVDGVVIGTGTDFIRAEHAPKLTASLKSSGCSHVLLAGGKAIGVPSAIAPLIHAAQEAAKLPPTLQEQRYSLVCAVAGAGDEWSAARERAFNADGGGNAWDRVAAAKSKIDAAEAALAAFDAAHPEIIATIKADEQVARDRFLAAD